MIDFHVHSNCSDGSLSPTELVDYAMKKGVSAFALTDHDTVAGLDEAISYTEKLRREAVEISGDTDSLEKSPKIPQVIPGIEFSTDYRGHDIHIVGLGLDYKSPTLSAYLEKCRNSRENRNRELCERLREAGIDITLEKLKAEFPDAVITRAHYGHYLINHGYTANMKEAFERYVGDHCPYFVPKKRLSPERAVELILAAEGIPVLAHPLLYRFSSSELEELVAQLKNAGLIGIEILYNSHSQDDERKLRRLAAKYHLLPSGGSDFHGLLKPGLEMGTGYGKLYIHHSVWEDLQKSKKKILFTDMDGTLLLDDGTISPIMREGIRKMTEAGHHLVLNSGRPLHSILEVCEKANLHFPNMYVCAYNGAVIYDCDKKEAIYERRLSTAEMETVERIVSGEGFYLHGYGDGEIVCYGPREELDYYYKGIGIPPRFVDNITKALPDGTWKMMAIHLTDRPRLEKLQATLQAVESLKSKVEVIFSTKYYLEVIPVGADKGHALRFLTDYFSVLRTHTFAAGDAENDLPMLKAAHVGVAMANAHEAVKAQADIITKKTNNENGLLEIIEEYFLD